MDIYKEMNKRVVSFFLSFHFSLRFFYTHTSRKKFYFNNTSLRLDVSLHTFHYVYFYIITINYDKVVSLYVIGNLAYISIIFQL